MKKSVGVSQVTVADPSRLRILAAFATISRVVPPPPSPQPVGARECWATPLSLKFFAAWAISLPFIEQL